MTRRTGSSGRRSSRKSTRPGSQSEFVSVSDVPRERFQKHPWSIGGGGAAELKESLEANSGQELRTSISVVGRSTVLGEDDIWILVRASAARLRVTEYMVNLVVGESLRDWEAFELPLVIYPYQSLGGPPVNAGTYLTTHYLWPYRTLLATRSVFGKDLADMERPWYEHLEHYREKLRHPLSIAFAFVATHNHFMLDRGGNLFKQSAPVIKLPEDAGEDDHIELLGLLNSSTACFWMKQVFHNKGSSVDQHGARQRTAPFEDFWEHDGTKLQKFPVPRCTATRPRTRPRHAGTGADPNAARGTGRPWIVGGRVAAGGANPRPRDPRKDGRSAGGSRLALLSALWLDGGRHLRALRRSHVC